MADIDTDPPLEVDPYSVLGIKTTATADEVKKAYRKLALRHHPDKAAPHDKTDAHTRFQELAFAYAILSDDRRRRRYDTTGNTSESLDIDSDDFNWRDFFRAQWQDAVTEDKIVAFTSKYKTSAEEQRDVLASYQRRRGDLNKVFDEVLLSSVLDDEERFREMIDGAIARGEVEGYEAYVNEPEKKRLARRRKAEREAKAAAEHAAELGVGGKKKKEMKPTKGGGKKDAEAELAEMIQQRQKGRAANFLDDLEAKYAKPKKAAANGRKRTAEPSEEAFAQMGKKMKIGKATKAAKRAVSEEAEDEDEDDGDVDLEATLMGEDDSEDLSQEVTDEENEEDEQEMVKPKKTRKKVAVAAPGSAKRKPMRRKK